MKKMWKGRLPVCMFGWGIAVEGFGGIWKFDYLLTGAKCILEGSIRAHQELYVECQLTWVKS